MYQSDHCKEKGHQVKRCKGIKRWFECKHCKKRTISLNKLPTKPCDQCDSQEWSRVAMMKVSSLPLHNYFF